MNKEVIKEYIRNSFKDVVINNNYFLDERVLNDFDLDFIVNKLLKLHINNAYPIFMNLYEFNQPKFIKDIIIYIVNNNINYFINDREDLFFYNNLFNEYKSLINNEDNNLDKLKEVEKINLENNSNKKIGELDISFYKELLIIQLLLKDKKINYNDILFFVDMIASMLRNKVVEKYKNYDIKFDYYINEIISSLLVNKISLEDFYKYMNSDECISSLLTISKLGLFVDISTANIEVIGCINGKKINNLYNEFENIYGQKNILIYFSKERIMKIITNMAILLKVDNVSNIIRHLPNDKEKINRLLKAFENINLRNIKINNNKIIYNNNFIKFIMGNNLNEPNSLLNLIYENKTNLACKIEDLYVYWDVYDTRYKSQILETRLSFLENLLNSNRVILNPDEYLLEGEIIDSYYDNKKFQKMDKLELINELRKEYKKMKHKYQKSIPYVSGKKDGYYYEILKANDPSIFEMGSVSNCCFKIGGDADSFLRYCVNDFNARVICIRDRLGRIVAMSPIVRNGNLILCNSVESKNYTYNEFIKKMFFIVEEISNKIIDISKKNEDENDRIKIVLMGGYKNKIVPGYERLKYGIIKDDCVVPLEKNIYHNLSGYDFPYYIMAKDINLDYNSLNSFDPSIRYEDPRSEVFELEKEFLTDKIKKHIMSIYYESTTNIIDFDNIEKVVFGEDWLIIIDNKNNIYSFINSNDKRAKDEYVEYLELIKEFYNNYVKEGFLK